MARQNGDTHQETYVSTKIKVAELAQLKAKRDTNIIGSTISGKKVEVDTGRDLHIQSLQDVDNFKEHSKSAGFSMSSKPNFKAPTGSINASLAWDELIVNGRACPNKLAFMLEKMVDSQQL